MHRYMALQIYIPAGQIDQEILGQVYAAVHARPEKRLDYRTENAQPLNIVSMQSVR